MHLTSDSDKRQSHVYRYANTTNLNLLRSNMTQHIFDLCDLLGLRFL